MNILNKAVVSVFASSKSRPLFILGGTLMKLLFRKRQDIYCLGHYLQSTGISVNLPDKLVQDAVDCLLDEGVSYDGIGFPPDEGVLFHTVGKFHFDIIDDKFRMWDKYMFYANCHHPSTHFDDCNCPDKDKSFAPLIKSFHFHHSLKTKVYTHKTIQLAECKEGKSYITVALNPGEITVTLHIYDSFWVGKGKPFMTFGNKTLTSEELNAFQNS